MSKQYRVVQALDRYGDIIWKVEVKTTFRPWWREVNWSNIKERALRMMEVLTKPETYRGAL